MPTWHQVQGHRMLIVKELEYLCAYCRVDGEALSRIGVTGDAQVSVQTEDANLGHQTATRPDHGVIS